jgi:hypothetical protein
VHQLVNKYNFDCIKMLHGTNVKIIEAQQERFCNSYKNTKLKLLKTNTEIWFNKMCLIKHVWMCEAYVIMWVWIWWVLLWCGCFDNGKQHSLTTLTEVFPCFSSVVRQMPGLNPQVGARTGSLKLLLLSFVM